MCALVGALLWNLTPENKERAHKMLNRIIADSHERGRDGRGFYSVTEREHYTPHKSIIRGDWEDWEFQKFFPDDAINAVVIGNLRAEPTTEYVKDKHLDDQQPYNLSGWNVVHNGTIANDKELRTYKVPTKIDSAAIVESLAQYPIPNPESKWSERFEQFCEVTKQLKGSYAIIASNDEYDDTLFIAVNYRPIWYIVTSYGAFFASSRNYLNFTGYVPKMIKPYTLNRFDCLGGAFGHVEHTLLPGKEKRALVVCSGGLDSTVAAKLMQVEGYEIELIHFQYGSRAEGPEVQAVTAVAQSLGAKLTLFPLPIYDPADSPLLRADSTIAGGEEGAEFAHEWVPARNLVLLSVATAYAEAKGFDCIVLGNNLEEAGAYPDNEPEFIDKFNDLLPFAVGDGKKVRVVMPVGNLMKHEIVAIGHHVNAPLDKTWSCYRAGELHCGTCGPCFMRRTAFAINDLPEVIQYKDAQ